MRTPGLVPSGNTAIADLIEKAVSVLYGAWAVAPITEIKDEPGEPFTLDGDTVLNVKTTITRAKVKTTRETEAAMWRSVREHLRDSLAHGDLTAAVASVDGRESDITRDNWEGESAPGWMVLETGRYDFTNAPPELDGQVVFIPDQQAAAFLSWVESWAALDGERDWTLEQALVWIMTGSPEMVREASPLRWYFDNRRASEPRDGETLIGLVLYGHWPARFPKKSNLARAEIDLIGKARNGELTATGIEDGRGKRKPVPVDFWKDADTFYWQGGKSGATKGRLPHPSEPHWTDLYFPAQAIRDLWGPMVPARTTPAPPPKEEPRPDRKRQKPGPEKGAWYSRMKKAFRAMSPQALDGLEKNMQPGTRKATAAAWQKKLAEHAPDKNTSRFAAAMDEAIAEVRAGRS